MVVLLRRMGSYSSSFGREATVTNKQTNDLAAHRCPHPPRVEEWKRDLRMNNDKPPLARGICQPSSVGKKEALESDWWTPKVDQDSDPAFASGLLFFYHKWPYLYDVQLLEDLNKEPYHLTPGFSVTCACCFSFFRCDSTTESSSFCLEWTRFVDSRPHGWSSLDCYRWPITLHQKLMSLLLSWLWVNGPTTHRKLIPQPLLVLYWFRDADSACLIERDYQCCRLFLPLQRSAESIQLRDRLTRVQAHALHVEGPQVEFTRHCLTWRGWSTV